VLLAAAGGAWAQAAETRTLRIDSVPAGAEVELVGGRAGVTPLTVGERDVYPNDYPDARTDMYGMVVLRRAGCESVRHRVTLTDFQQGLRVDLDCGATAAGLEAPPPLAKPGGSGPSPGAQPPPASADLPERRLRQLQVLQELLDEGLISPAEEQRIRRRILAPAAGGG
jgi:hypothetical protein